MPAEFGELDFVGKASRQCGGLAEGQMEEDVEHFFTPAPPSARQIELAEWVEFSEKNACFWQWRAPFGKEGVQAGIATCL